MSIQVKQVHERSREGRRDGGRRELAGSQERSFKEFLLLLLPSSRS